jgi:hypothetical protein
MQKLYFKATRTTPEVHFSLQENIFIIRGVSTPEDVRAMYYPVIEWVKLFVNNILEAENKLFSVDSPLNFKIDLIYFNSSSAKFLYDIFMELKRLIPTGTPVVIEWFYDEEDIDLKDAGSEIALLAGMEFTYISKKRNSG